MVKDRTVRALAGLLFVLCLVIQKSTGVDLTIVMLGVAINLLQFGITGYCPVQSYFKKIGWLQNS